MSFSAAAIRSVSVYKKGKVYVRTDVHPGLEILELWTPQYLPGAIQMYVQQALQCFVVLVSYFSPVENKVEVERKHSSFSLCTEKKKIQPTSRLTG